MVINKNFGRNVPPRFLQIGVSGTIFFFFFDLKLVSQNELLLNFVFQELKLSENSQKLVLKCKIYLFSKNGSGASGAGKRLKKVGLRS